MKNVQKCFRENTIEQILDQLTIEQEIALCSGRNEWDTKEMRARDGSVLVPSVKVADGPHGLRKTIGQGDNLGLAKSEPATCFPAESLLACSFDRTLARKMGEAIGKEARAAGVCTVLGPGVNIKRNPLCGRSFEYLSEDPFLSGQLAAAYIQGVESTGVGTSLKHFACNSQEHYRMLSDSRLDERTLREIYLPAFEQAVKQGKPATVMCAYNKVNGVSCSDNAYLLDTILRKEWGFEGMVVSDWGAINNRTEAFRAGCDLVMPGGSAYGEAEVKTALQEGKLSRGDVHRSAERVAAFAIKRHQVLEAYADQCKKTPLQLQKLQEQSHILAREIAEGSAVLLKNQRGALPLDPVQDPSLCIIGAMAEHFRFQGSGSSKINPVKTEQFFDCLWEQLPYEPGYSLNGTTDDALLEQAVVLAKKAETVILFAGLPEQYEAEGIDRRTMALPEAQNRLIARAAEVNENVIVVLVCGCVVELPWEPQVDTILWMGLSGQAGAAALVRLLTGEVNPSGRLAETWPERYEDCPSAKWYLKEGRNAAYKEGIYVGYRYYHKYHPQVRFPFGHGLSYTSFAYSNLSISPISPAVDTEVMDTGTAQHGCVFEISVAVTNTGSRAGGEAVLLFVEAPQSGISRPIRELKGFEKIQLQPGESKTITFKTDERSFALWNEGWKVYGGTYAIEIGSCREMLQIEGLHFDECCHSEAAEKKAGSASAEALPAESVAQRPYTVDSTIAEIAEDVLLLRIIYRWFERKQAKTFGRDSADYLAAMTSANECPLRAVQNLTGIRHHFAQAIADFGNGHYLKGLRNLLR